MWGEGGREGGRERASWRLRGRLGDSRVELEKAKGKMAEVCGRREGGQRGRRGVRGQGGREGRGGGRGGV